MLDLGLTLHCGTPLRRTYSIDLKTYFSFFDIWRMSAKRIMHLSSESTWRGGEQQMAYLIEESVKAGLKINVVCKSNSAFSEWCEKKNIHYHELNFTNGLDINTSLHLKRLATQLKPDLIHTHSGKSQSLIYWAALMGLNVPVVVHRRVDFPLKSKGLSLKKYTFGGVKAIICVSKTIEKMVRDQAEDRVDQIQTIYSGIDFQRFDRKPPTGYIHRELGLSQDTVLISNISALAPHKDYHTFLRVAKHFLAEEVNVHFLIVGEGPLEVELKDQCRKMGLEKLVTFTGFRTDIPDLFREISIFLITSETEGLGTTVIDAMYNELPVVATKGGGIPELIIDGSTGYLCDVADDGCLAVRVKELTDNPSKIKTMGIEGGKRSMLFSKEEMAQQVMEVYEKLGV